ncbi:MAG: tetratricopeptide repeat protein [Burkholderiales bacterium]|nr:tetratricopeptide repeat protein [Burkholderiales bacterium]
MTTPAHGRRAIWLLAGLTALLALLLYLPTLRYSFVGVDDQKHLADNPLILRGAASDLAELWARPYFGHYVPVNYTVWFAVARLANGDRLNAFNTTLQPAWFHAANVLCHALNVLLLCLLLWRLTGHPGAAVAGALLFAVHPLQVESVAWISSFRDPFSATWALLACHAYLRFTAGGRGCWGWYAAALACFVLGLLTKPQAVALPLVLAALDHWVGGRPWPWVAVALAPWLAPALAVVLLTAHTQPGAEAVAAALAPWYRPLIALDALAFYLGKLVWPAELALDYGRTPQHALQQGWLYWTWLLPATVAAGLAWWGRRQKLAPVAAALALTGVLPVLGLVPFAYQIHSTVADRYAYLALAGVALALAAALARVRRPWPWLAAGLVLALFAARTVQHLPVWRDSDHLLPHMLAVNPRSWLGNTDYGALLERRERFAAAEPYLRRGAELRPDQRLSWDLLATLYQHWGRHQDAERCAREALRVAPNTPDALTLLGEVLGAQRRATEALEYYDRALRLAPQFGRAHLGAAAAALALDRYPLAEYHCRQVLARRPNSQLAWHRLGVALYLEGRRAEALGPLQRAVDLQPDAADSRFMLGVTLLKEGRAHEAVPHLREAALLTPDDPVRAQALTAAELLAGDRR